MEIHTYAELTTTTGSDGKVYQNWVSENATEFRFESEVPNGKLSDGLYEITGRLSERSGEKNGKPWHMLLVKGKAVGPLKRTYSKV